jgi:hypothetical protein
MQPLDRRLLLDPVTYRLLRDHLPPPSAPARRIDFTRPSHLPPRHIRCLPGSRGPAWSIWSIALAGTGREYR